MGVKRTRQRLGPMFSEGSRLLWVESLRLGHSQEDIRRELGCSGGLVHRWLYGDKRIQLSYAVKIQYAYGVPVEAWLSKPSDEDAKQFRRQFGLRSAPRLAAA